MGVWVEIDDHPVFIENAKGPYSKGKDGKITYTGKDHKGGTSAAVASGPGSSRHDPVPMKIDSEEGRLDERGPEYKALADKVDAAVTMKQKWAVGAWAGTSYEDIRKVDMDLPGHTPSPPVAKWHKDLYGAMNALPKHEGTSYRGIRNLSEDQVETIRNASEIKVEAVSSYSRRPMIGYKFASEGEGSRTTGVLFKFKGKAAEISPLTGFREMESEVLHKKGDKFKVTKTYWASTGMKGHNPVLVVEGHQI